MSRSIHLAVDPETLQREGLQEKPEAWEDGLRLEPKPGNFEWWYFEAHLEDGSTVVITFFTKTLLDRRSRLNPGVAITVTGPDGKKRTATSVIEPEEFSASKERCYVRAGESYARGDLASYELHARAGDLSANLNMTADVPAWRPGAGKIYADEARARFFAWLPAMPYGSVEGFLTYDGKIHSVKGTCYHDHNWGNVGINDLLTHWYWGRAHLGDYTLIFAEMHATPRFGQQRIPVLMLAKGKQILVGDGAPLRIEEGEFIADPGGRSYPDGLEAAWEKDGGKIEMKLRDPELIDSFSLLEMLPTWQRLIGSLLVNPYYFRFRANLELCVSIDGVQEKIQGEALYELMLLQ